MPETFLFLILPSLRRIDNINLLGINWDKTYEELAKSRFLYHNDDYIEFLVRRVWRFDKPINIVDFGCGYGWIGLKLLPLLSPGSCYTGVDQAKGLLDRGNKIFSTLDCKFKFIQSDAHNVPLHDNAFDVAICHALLVHLDDQEKVIEEMVRVTRDGGTVIIVAANRLTHMAAYYTSGPVQPNYDLGLMQKYYGNILKNDKKDYNIGFKIPAILHRLGLIEIECRISDCVRCHLTGAGSNDNRQKLLDAISSEGYGIPIDDNKAAEIEKTYISYGIAPDAAKSYTKHLQKQIDNFIENAGDFEIVYPGLMSFTYGRVNK